MNSQVFFYVNGVYKRESGEETEYQCEDRKDCQCSYQPVKVIHCLVFTFKSRGRMVMVLLVGTGHFQLHNCLWMIKVIMSRTTAPSFTDSLLESTDALICST